MLENINGFKPTHFKSFSLRTQKIKWQYDTIRLKNIVDPLYYSSKFELNMMSTHKGLIYFIGLPASGKSTIGNIIAKKVNYK